MGKSGEWHLREEEKSIMDLPYVDSRDAEQYWEYQDSIAAARNDIIPFLQGVWSKLFLEWGEDAIHTKELQDAIWKASTVMLPNLEVQVVIDGKNRAHISSGTSGYVSFLQQPIGLSVPIKCWFHTHPFGAAYFSGTDWSTVIPWTPLMSCAYVIGGDDHYGFWSNLRPNELEIKQKDGSWTNQYYTKAGEEE